MGTGRLNIDPRRPDVDDDPIETAGRRTFTIDCRDCAHRSSPVCEDCVVSFIVDRSPEDAVVIDAGEARAVRLLERAGLVPGSRHRRRVG